MPDFSKGFRGKKRRFEALCPPAFIRSGGFTLIELMVVIGILSILGIAFYGLFSSYMRLYTEHKGVIETQQNVRACLYYMESEFKQAGLNPLGIRNQNALVTTATPSEFKFQYLDDYRSPDAASWNGTYAPDGRIEGDEWVEVRYFIENNTLKRWWKRSGRGYSYGNLVENVNTDETDGIPASRFEFLDTNNVVLAQSDWFRDRIRSVRILLEVRTPQDRQGNSRAIRLESTVKCRNLGV